MKITLFCLPALAALVAGCSDRVVYKSRYIAPHVDESLRVPCERVERPVTSLSDVALVLNDEATRADCNARKIVAIDETLDVFEARVASLQEKESKSE